MAEISLNHDQKTLGYRYKEKVMLIRKATGEEMLALWGYLKADELSPTAQFFNNHISSGNTIFWTLDNDGELVGELYAFLKLEDKDFADGQSTAYLCAFRVRKEYRGQGYGSQMMATAFAALKDIGFHHVTIGVSSDEPKNIRLYRRLGFKSKVKDCHFDPCGMDKNMQPLFEETAWWLLKKDL